MSEEYADARDRMVRQLADRGRIDRESTLEALRAVPRHEFVVGETERASDEEFTVEGIQVREGAPKYRRDKFDHEGDAVYAKDVKRVYGQIGRAHV